MWSGSTANIPAGWSLCDGTNGTPDLVDRFVVAAGGSYSPGASGNGGGTVSSQTGIVQSYTGYYPFTVVTSVGGVSNIMPKYYALAYIMKL
jgi:hypothetical protein